MRLGQGFVGIQLILQLVVLLDLLMTYGVRGSVTRKTLQFFQYGLPLSTERKIGSNGNVLVHGRFTMN